MMKTYHWLAISKLIVMQNSYKIHREIQTPGKKAYKLIDTSTSFCLGSTIPPNTIKLIQNWEMLFNTRIWAKYNLFYNTTMSCKHDLHVS